MSNESKNGFWSKLFGSFAQVAKAIKELLPESGVFWGALIGSLDPAVRPRAEEFAFKAREAFEALLEKLREHGVKLDFDKIRGLIEGVVGAFRGGLEMALHDKLSNEFLIVLSEKIFVDLPDLAANILFSSEEEYRVRLAQKAATSEKTAMRLGISPDQREKINGIMTQLYENLGDILHKNLSEESPEKEPT